MPRVSFADRVAKKFDAVKSDDAGIRSITKPRESHQQPHKLKYGKVAAKDGSITLDEASKWTHDWRKKTGQVTEEKRSTLLTAPRRRR